MNKYKEYQEALYILRNIEQSHNYKQIGSSLTPNSDTLQELVVQTKTPTLEEVKKEWEKRGWVWKENKMYIAVENDRGNVIEIDLKNKSYVAYHICFDENNTITLDLHILLSKTFKALGWYDE